MYISEARAVSPPRLAYRPAWYLGLDLGQRQDYSALATIELVWQPLGRNGATWELEFSCCLAVRGLQRFPLGTSYLFYPGAVKRRIAQINVPSHAVSPYAAHAGVTLVVDAGGPGVPVVEELRRSSLGATLWPLVITGGVTPGHLKNGFLSVPRRELISNLILMLDRGTLRASPELSNWDVLESELLELSANDSHPVATTAHDDLVMAVAIAAWRAKVETPALLLPVGTPANPRYTPKGRLF